MHGPYCEGHEDPSKEGAANDDRPIGQVTVSQTSKKPRTSRGFFIGAPGMGIDLEVKVLS